MSLCYLDTSALAKRYINEAFSDDVDAYLARQSTLLITDLTTAEMRSMLARRRRDGEIDSSFENQAFAAYLDDIGQGHLVERPLSPEILTGAVNVIGQHPDVPLRTLDAIHLAAATHLGVERLATADRRMRDAARAMDLATDYFAEA
jgi:hypothetical protein